jgi:hypothetical protein
MLLEERGHTRVHLPPGIVLLHARVAHTRVASHQERDRTVDRGRRDQALLRTARVRPDLLAGPAGASLDERDRRLLQGAGFELPDEHVAELQGKLP